MYVEEPLAKFSIDSIPPLAPVPVNIGRPRSDSNGSNHSRVSIEDSDSRTGSGTATPLGVNGAADSQVEPEVPQTPVVRNYGAVVNGPEGREFVENPQATMRRRSVTFADEKPTVVYAPVARRPSREDTELKLKKWEQDFNQRQQGRQKQVAQTVVLPASVMNPNQRRSSFSILDWKMGDDENPATQARRMSLDNVLKAEPAARPAKKVGPKGKGADKKVMSLRKSMSLLREEEEGLSDGYLASSENLSENVSSSLENVSSSDTLGSSASQPENIMALIRKRRGSLPLGSMEELKAMGEVKPASQVIEEFNETTTQTPKGSWRISTKHSKSSSIVALGEASNTFVSTNPLFNLQNIDFSQTPEKKEEVFKKKFNTLTKGMSATDLEEKDDGTPV